MSELAVPAQRAGYAARVRGLGARSAVPLAAAIVGLCYTVTGFNAYDETWFLQVVARMRDGDVLYRDVAYGAGPLPVYVTQALTHIVGIDIFAVKLAVVAAFAAEAALVWMVCERLDLSPSVRIAATASLVYFAPPLQASPYAPAAQAFLLAALLCVLSNRFLLAGVAAAAAFACKQDVGLVTLAATTVSLVGAEERRRIKNLLLSCTGFTVTAALLLTPVVATGGLARYVDYGFTGKHAYVSDGGVSYVDTLHGVLHLVRSIRTEFDAEAAFLAGNALLPILAVLAGAAIVAAAFTRRATRTAVPIVAFACASATSLYPRADTAHVVYAAPALVLLIVYAYTAWRPSLAAPAVRSATIVTAACVGAAVVIALLGPERAIRSHDSDLSDIPHLRGTFAPIAERRELMQSATRIAAAARREATPLVVLTSNAAFFYLATGLHNPTPFDYPLSSTFGGSGQARVVAALESGRIPRACLASAWTPHLAPTEIVRYVTANMTRGADLGPCTLYRRS